MEAGGKLAFLKTADARYGGERIKRRTIPTCRINLGKFKRRVD